MDKGKKFTTKKEVPKAEYNCITEVIMEGSGFTQRLLSLAINLALFQM